MSETMHTSHLSTNDLFRVSVDVSQSRLIQLLDNILGRISKLESGAPARTPASPNPSQQSLVPPVSAVPVVHQDAATLLSAPTTFSSQQIHSTITVVDGKPVSLMDVVTTQNTVVKETVALKEQIQALQEAVATPPPESALPRVHLLEDIVKESQVKEAETQSKVEELTTTITEQRDRVHELERQTKKLDDEQTIRLESLSNQFHRTTERQREHEKDVVERLAQLETLVNTQNTTIDSMKSRIEELENQLNNTNTNLEERYSRLRDNISETSASVQTLEQQTSSDLAALRVRVDGLEGDTRTASENDSEMKTRLDAMSHDHREQMARLSSAISALQMRILDLAATEAAPPIMSAGSNLNITKSLASKGADAVILQDIRQAMSGLSQRVEGVEASVIKVSKYVKDQQASTDRILTTTQRNVRQQLQSAVDRLQSMQKTTRSQLSRQLVDFERDLMYVLDSRRAASMTTAAGKVAVRCLTCDQPVGDVSGPYSQHYMHTQSINPVTGTLSGAATATGVTAGHHSPTRTTNELLNIQARAHAHNLAMQCAELGMDPSLGHNQGQDVVRKLGLVERAQSQRLKDLAAIVEVGGLVDGAEPLSTETTTSFTSGENGMEKNMDESGKNTTRNSAGNPENPETTPRTRPATSISSAHTHTDAALSTSPRPATVPVGTGIRGGVTDGKGSRMAATDSAVPLPLGLASAKSLMVVSKGGEVGIPGSDGRVYQGRTNTRVLFAPPSTAVNPNFTLAYTDKVPSHLLPSLSQSLAGNGVMMLGVGAARSATAEMGPFAAVKTSMSSIAGAGTLVNPYLDEEASNSARRAGTGASRKGNRVGTANSGKNSPPVDGDDVSLNRGYFSGTRSAGVKSRPVQVPAGWSGPQTHTLGPLSASSTSTVIGSGGDSPVPLASGTGVGVGGLRRGVSRRKRVSSVANGMASANVLDGMVVANSAHMNRRAEERFGEHVSEDGIPEQLDSGNHGFAHVDGHEGARAVEEEVMFENIDDIPGGNAGECEGGGHVEDETV